MCNLAEIMKITLQFHITTEQVSEVKEGLIDWVKKYEKYYYQYHIERMSACTLTVHGLLHLAQGIRDCSPVWTTWTFYMEHFCALLQNNLQYRSHPWSNLNKSVLHMHMAYLEQLTVRFNVSDELEQLDDQKDDGPIALKLNTVCHHLHSQQGSSEFIQNSGDTFRTKQVCRQSTALSWRNFYVRYEVVFQGRTEAITQISYGDLKKIVVLTTPIDPFFANLSGKSLALALIKPWNTDGKLTSKENVYMTTRKASIVTDICSLKAVVGLVETHKKWGVINQAPATVATSFAEDNAAEDSDSEDEMLW
ncbi:hypothetical protein BS17DRAFT_754034 [Gyrodon lividus]|nr:hypothetical protein BS17DRAFT_754034 [Gyrodon lividus]